MVETPTTVAREETDVERTGVGARELAIAGAAGLVGTLAMTPVLAVAWALGALDPAAFGSLATVVGFGPSIPLGIAIFVAGGTVTLPLLYVTLSMFLPGRTLAAKGAVFATAMWTGFAIAFYTRQAGLSLAVFLVLTLVAHLVYGYVMGSVYDRFAHPVEWVV